MIRPSLRHAGAEPHQHGMAAAMAVEHLLAREADLHRPVEQQRRLRDDDLVVERIALAAEAAAVRRGDHADVRRRHAPAPSRARGAGSAASGARPDHELAVGIHRRDRRVLLDRQVRVPLEEEHVVEHVVGAGERRVDVAELRARRACGRCRRRRTRGCAAPACARLSSGLRTCAAARTRRRSRSTRLGRGGLVARDDRGHRIADEPHLVAAQRLLVLAHGQDAVGDREMPRR